MAFEWIKTQAWRREQLARAGYSEQDAAALAEHNHVDLHAAVALVAGGCPPALAVRILL
ncbi:MAG TPA: hypothetical protein VGH82_02620 [Gaiellaceae bacterium]|jgi:hypothetical protein